MDSSFQWRHKSVQLDCEHRAVDTVKDDFSSVADDQTFDTGTGTE